MDYTERARKILFKIAALTPFDICDILQKLKNTCIINDYVFKEFLKSELEKILEDEMELEKELRKI